MKRIFIFAIVVVLIVALVSAFVVTSFVLEANKHEEFYVGVTYCGNSTADAKLLVDKVANYTNLFVVQSGPLMTDSPAIIEIGDYAVANGLHFAVFYDTSQIPERAQWLSNVSQRWGDMFGGVYYADEPAGKLLDTQITLVSPTTGAINKYSDGTINIRPTDSQNSYSFYPNGTIQFSTSNNTGSSQDGADFFALNSDVTYSPDGSVTVFDSVYKFIDPLHGGGMQPISKTFYTPQNGSERIAQEPTYQQMQTYNPVPNVDVATNLFLNKTSSPLDGFSNYWNLSNRSFPIFTSDYVLYWWDYKAGYDMVLAQLGWNNTVNQEIGLARGAANLQNKSWGTIITWKYMQEPYLPSGNEMFEQLRASYEAGAKYAIIFNYAENMTGPYGTMQDEHFQALERFWLDIVKNPFTQQGSTKADAVLVLPKDFGWGMRNPDDKIWGIWNANSTCQQIWTVLQGKLSTYGAKLDIVYDDPAYPVAGKYNNIYYWNQTS